MLFAKDKKHEDSFSSFLIFALKQNVSQTFKEFISLLFFSLG